MMKTVLQLTLLLLTAIPLYSVTLPVTVNCDATVIFTNARGAGSSTETVNADTPKDVTLSWVTGKMELNVSIESNDSRFNDTTFTTTLSENTSNYPAWNSSSDYTVGFADTVSHKGKNWTNGWWANAGDEPGVADVWKLIEGEESFAISVTLSLKPLPTDSAYIPFTVNVDAMVKAIPLSMISGEMPGDEFTFNLSEKTAKTLALPVRTDATGIQKKSVKSSTVTEITYLEGNHNLILPSAYHRGSVELVNVRGQRIAKVKLDSDLNNTVSVRNTAVGIYFVKVKSLAGTQSVHKLSHNGGDLRISAQYGEIASRSYNTSRVAFRSAMAQYRFKVTPVAPNFNDTSFTKDLEGQLNGAVSIRLRDPNQKAANLEDYLDSSTYEAVFPHRYGIDSTYMGSQPGGDFYTYGSFKEAIKEIAKYRTTVSTKATSGGDKVVVEHPDGSIYTYYSINDYESNTSEETIRDVDYSGFLNIGNATEIKEELVAFLAHIGSETTGGWDAAPDGRWGWGLHFIHEAGNSSSTVGQYVAHGHAIYPPAGGQSYHGRGPKQLSWNYNYGQFSDFVYKNKSVLLNNPNMISEDPVLAFMSALWFWMTPQGKKPSCHMVMANIWQPDAHDIAGGRDISKFGMTTNIINGGIECGSSFHPANNTKRLGHYNFFADLMQITPEPELSCRSMKNYNEW